MSRAECTVCPHRCRLEDGQTGFCRARSCRGGEVRDDNYGRVTSLALDPIEKKPLRRFHPGSRILSAGSYGCNLRCPFCQNHTISMAGAAQADAVYVPPETLVRKARELTAQGNIGIAYTYNEPLVGFEYVRDCARAAAAFGLKNVVVTNGYVCEEPLRELLPLIDAMNIDLKSFSEGFYRDIAGGLADVKRSISLAVSACHVEVTTLIVPGENDSPDEMRRLARWLALLRPDIPLHITRFFPRFRMADRSPTSVETVRSLARIARESLEFVYEGNC